MVELAHPQTQTTEHTLEKRNGSGFTVEGRFCGMLYTDSETGDGVYVSYKSYSSHYYYLNEGYAISKEIIDSLNEAGVDTICIVEDMNTVYVFDTDVYLNAEVIDHGDEQYAPGVKKADEVHDYTVRENETYPDTINF